MDSKFYVSLEVARLLKEKGYDRECISYYYDNCREINYSFCGERNSTWEERCVSAPTKSEAIDWLESNGIMIDINWIRFNENRRCDYSIFNCSNCYIIDSKYIYSTRLEAEEAAIIEALELL